MNENRTIHLVDIPIGGEAGFIWNRLHGEREDICEALLKDHGLVARRTPTSGFSRACAKSTMLSID